MSRTGFVLWSCLHLQRESVARKKQEDLVKRSHSSSELAGASGGSSASLQPALKSRERSKLDISDSQAQANKISAKSNVKALNKAQPGQKKEAFSTSKSTGALDKMPAYHQLKERIDAEQQAHLDVKPRNLKKMILAFESGPLKEEALGTNKSSSTTQLSSTVDLPSKEPSLKKMVTLNPEPILLNLEPIKKERGGQLPANDKMKEAVQLTNTQVDRPSEPSILNKTVSVSSKSVLSNFKPAPSSSIPKEIGIERRKVQPVSNETKEKNQFSHTAQVEAPAIVPSLKKTVPIKTKPVLSKFKMTPSPLTPDEIRKERGKLLPATCKTRETVQSNSSTTNEEEKLHTSNLAERSTLSLKTLLESLPRRKKLLTDTIKEKCGFNTNEPFLIEKNWRSKHWKSYQHREKSKVFHGNEHNSIGSFCGWMFLEEMIYPCVLNDNSPFVDALKGCLSDSSPQLDDQEKHEDTGVTHSKSEKDSNGSKKEESIRRPKNIPLSGPAGQVMKIAIMVGFGILVILTRQRK